ncbi:MAG: copper-containing nitrite reductase [Candidatus Limnocylindria bacterium]
MRTVFTTVVLGVLISVAVGLSVAEAQRSATATRGHSAPQAGPAAQPASAPVAVIPAQASPASVVDVARSPADLPAPIQRSEPANVTVTLETREVVGILADGSTYAYWTFDGTVPGPFIRVRVGDTVELHLKNAQGSAWPHSIDLHAVTGPGGGAGATQTTAGGQTSFRFKALNPGLYVYHCATAPIPMHVASGMYGLILVEPAGGLPPVDREFYVVQAELYTSTPAATKGHKTYAHAKALDERPDHVVMNGRVGALTGDRALRARVGETIRIYYGVGGFLISSFHVIGEIFDAVYPEGAVGAEPLRNVQTTLVPAGGATMVELKLEVPGRYLLVDHNLPRALDKGAAGYLEVEGPEAPEIFHGAGGAGH